jgi:opacity protein-like surface antigen
VAMRRADLRATSGMGRRWTPSGEPEPIGPARAAACARASKDVMMRPKTTTALALAGTMLAVPAALAAEADDPPSPARAALHASVGGHLTVQSQMRAEARQNRQQDLLRRAVSLSRKIADARGERFDASAARARLRDQAPDELLARLRGLRRNLRDAQAPASPVLEAIAACESGGDPTTDTGNGFYGKYQFTLGTWQAVGGSGNPARASEAEQDRRAAILYEQAGASPWPVCGR